MVLASISEVLTIGAILPFLGVLMAPERVYSHDFVQPMIRLLAITEPKQLLLPLTVAFAAVAVFAGACRMLLLWASTRLAFALGTDLSINIYRRTLYQPYAVHIARHSSDVIAGIANKAHSVIFATIQPALTLVSSSMMLVVILLVLFLIDPAIALIAFGGFGAVYLLVVKLTRRRLTLNSERIARESTQVIKALQEGLGGIRDVLLDGTQSTYCKIYNDANIPLRKAQGNNLFIGQSPRYGIEALGMIMIAALAYSLAQQEGGVATAIPVLGALALGAQRLLPVLQQAYGGWSDLQGGRASLQDTLELLNQPLPEGVDGASPVPLPFNSHVELKKISHRYTKDGPKVLHNLDLVINKGGRIGFVGTTGSGKSTLLDIVMGLLQPSDGVLEVDGCAITAKNQRAWQLCIAHVPQSIFLADTTVEQNIAFGVPKDKIDRERVREAARKAQIAATIESWPDGYQAMVGERGVRLSGGQRQRIGIARALYKRANVIVFDEATSALDSETERAVMESIDGLSRDLTVLVVAHRLTTLKGCAQVVELAEGQIRRIGSYAEIVTELA
jgi:ATP-binding cassette subfamily B protein